MIVGGFGVIALIYILIAATIKPGDGRAPSARERDQSLLVGEMADFTYPIVQRAAPPVQFYQDGEALTLNEFHGKAILVNFWATWCAPCLAELPSLDALDAKFDDERFQVVAIASDPRGPEAAGEMLERLNVKNLELYADPQLALITAFGGSNVLPLSILFDRRGNEIGRLLGEADWDTPEAEALIRSILN